MADLLVLTSCIRPAQQDNLKLGDWEERYGQTITSLKYYIDSGTFEYIVICDGSGYDLSSDDIMQYADKHGVDLESLSFIQNQELVKKKGKGFGEGEIMSYIVCNSRLFKASNFFIKVTGRLIVTNIGEIVHKIDIAKAPFFNIIISKVIGSVDTRVYGMTTSMYAEYFIDAYQSVDDSKGNTYEIVFGKVLKANNISFSPLPIVPILQGKSGTDNKDYSKDITYYANQALTKLGVMNSMLAYVVLGLVRLFVITKTKLKK